MRFNLPRLIGITGKAGAGKDTLADYLVSRFGYRKYSLSSPLKRLLNERFGWSDWQWQDREWKERPAITGMFEAFGQVGIQDPALSPRQLAQWLGTEVGRYLGGDDVWVNMMEREWRSLNETNTQTFGELPRMVVPDVRFDNEARRIHLLGGVVLRVVRDGVSVVPAHVSEAGVSDALVNVQVVNYVDIVTFLRESVYALEICPRGEAGDGGPLESGDL